MILTKFTKFSSFLHKLEPQRKISNLSNDLALMMVTTALPYRKFCYSWATPEDGDKS